MTARRSSHLGVALATAVLLLVSAMTAGVVLAFHRSDSQLGVRSSAPNQVRIVRIPGLLEVSPLDRTIRDSRIVASLARDLRNLPPYPRAERCPADFGLYYALTFEATASPAWTADVGAQGCEIIEMAGQRATWAAHSPQLWSDLATALGLTPSEVQPPICLGTAEPGCAPVATSTQP